jgi:SNF2 family DNA or RNA helicase
MKIVSRSGRTLRFPQPISINKLRDILPHEHGALLADSMGLGKTATAVNVAVLMQMDRVLVICPKSAIPDWRREIVDWDKRHGMIQHRKSLAFRRGWTLINYEQLYRLRKQLRRHGEWDLIIVDEVQATKEPDRQRTSLIYGGQWPLDDGEVHSPIPHRKALIISGTPLKNRIEELFNQLHFIDPIKWPDRDAFLDAYYEWPRIVTPEHKVVMTPTRNLDGLHQELQSVMVRTHKDTVVGMPSKRFELIPVPVHPASSAAVRLGGLQYELNKAYGQLRSYQRKFYGTHPDLENKIKRLHDNITKEAVRLKWLPIMDYLISLTEKTVVIGFHRELMLDQIARALRQHGRGVVEHNGDTSDDVEWTKKKFNDDPSIQFFVGQLNVSNLSLTLTRSKHIVFLELPQTWSDFEQAMDRIHRYGQIAPEVTITAFVLFEAGDGLRLEQLQNWKDQSDMVLDGRELPPIPWRVLEIKPKHTTDISISIH